MDIRDVKWFLANEALNIWRYRWLSLALAWTIAIAGWLYVLSLPNEYAASARVYVDTETVLRPLLRGLAVEPDTESQIELMTRALTARPQLEKVAETTGLSTRALTPQEFERLLISIERRIGINQVRGQQIYSIRFTDSSPEMATQVVQALLNSFIENTLEGDRSEAAQAQRFLREQLSTYEARLLEAEGRLAAFKRENVGLMPGQGGGYYQRLQTTQSAVQSLKGRIDTIRERRATLVRQLDSEGPLGPGDASRRGSPLDVTISNFENQLSDLLLRYTEKHPEVISTRETLQDLYRMRDQQSSGGGGTDGAPSAPPLQSGNPVYQELRIALSDTEVELAAAESELREQERMLSFLRSQVDTIPEVEAELNRLNRDYDVVKAQYETMLGRLESAKLAEQLQADSESIKFDIIDPPRVPIFAIGPKRGLLAAFVLAVAIAVGVGVAFLLAQQRPLIYTTFSLKESIELPIYGVVERAQSFSKGSAFVLFSFFGIMLLLAFGVVASQATLLRRSAAQLLVTSGVSL